MLISREPETQLSPAEYARELLTKLDIKKVPVYPRKIAEEMGIFVQERAAEGEYDGYLMCANGVWGIMINGSIKSKARKRFTVAHELGHYCIKRHDGNDYQCFRQDITDMDPSARQDEREANEFAVELLMPNKSFRADVQERNISIDTINYLTAKYETSITSTAIRYARSSPDACAVVLSERGKIKYFAYSEGFRKGKYLYLTRNAPLKDGSHAKKLYRKGLKLAEEYGEVTASAWSANAVTPELTIMEHSRCLSTFRQVLSLIWFEQHEKPKSPQIAHVLVE